MNSIVMAQDELLESYVIDVNNISEMFLSIKIDDEVTLVDNNVFLVKDENDKIIALYGRNSHGIHEYFNMNNVKSIKFCRRTGKGIVDAIDTDEPCMFKVGE